MRRSAARSLMSGDSSSENEARIKIVPLRRVRHRWEEFIESNPCARLYHRIAWTEALRRAYGFRICAATLECDEKITAGCILAQSNIPFVSRFIGLPFSDSCAPLSANDGDMQNLLAGLTRAPEVRGRIEVRGIEAPAPWQTTNYFRQWSLDLMRPFSEIQRALDRNFRRQVRRAVAHGFRIDSGDSEHMLGRFYRLQLETRRRLGVPPQPLRFFELVRQEFARNSDFEVWLVSCDGVDHAGVVVLRDGPRIYAKWSARSSHSSDGASHMVFLSILEHYAEKAVALDLGRTDVSNLGLVRFKSEMGAVPSNLPYSYYPVLRRSANSESPDRSMIWLEHLWRRLPLAVTRAIGAAAYGFLG
jgi:Acetyltransferase (GNAT) domain